MGDFITKFRTFCKENDIDFAIITSKYMEYEYVHVDDNEYQFGLRYSILTNYIDK